MNILSKLLKLLKPKRKIIHLTSYSCKNPGVEGSSFHGHVIALCDDGSMWLKHMEKPNGWIQLEGIPE